MSLTKRILFVLFLSFALMRLSAAGSAPRVVDLNSLPDITALAPALSAKRVVFVGEMHDRYDHHLNQLDVIRQLYRQDRRLAIGVECFQQPYQSYLDDYIAGRIDERELLRGTQYYERWRFDFRLYAPILAFAREHKIPVIALNVPSEITRKVAHEGLSALTPEERKWVPESRPASEPYRARLRDAFEQHPGNGGPARSFDNFVAAQLVWDEAMAERAAVYLRQHPQSRMALLAGSGHLAYGDGIPQRLLRRIAMKSAIVLPGGIEPLAPGVADYLLLSEQKSLPPAGALGVLFGQGKETNVVDFAPDSAAAAAGLKRGDVITSVDGQPVASIGDIKAMLWGRKPGDKVTVRARRDREELKFNVTLRALAD